MLRFRSKTHLLTLYFLDSGAYSGGVLDWLGLFHGDEYDWIRESQINWFLQESGMCPNIRYFYSADSLLVSFNRSHRTTLYAGRDQGSFFYLETTGSRSDCSEHPATCQTECSHVLPYPSVCAAPPSFTYFSL